MTTLLTPLHSEEAPAAAWYSRAVPIDGSVVKPAPSLHSRVATVTESVRPPVVQMRAAEAAKSKRRHKRRKGKKINEHVN